MLRRNLHTVVIAAVVAAITAGAPALARTVVGYARNAGHVNGYQAVRSRTSAEARGRKLVATDRDGYLPNFIVGEVGYAQYADNSGLLAGIRADQFQHACYRGTVLGYADVPGDTPQARSDVEGFSCFGGTTSAEHPSPGLYEVSMSLHTVQACQEGQTWIPAIIALRSSAELVATYQTTCSAPGLAVEQVQIRDVAGAPTDSDFTIMVPYWVGAPVVP